MRELREAYVLKIYELQALELGEFLQAAFIGLVNYDYVGKETALPPVVLSHLYFGSILEIGVQSVVLSIEMSRKHPNSSGRLNALSLAVSRDRLTAP